MGENTSISPESVVLVSGGARGITAQCVIKLAQQVPCKFILLGRTPVDVPFPQWAQEYTDDAGLKRGIMDHLMADGKKSTPQIIDRQFRQFRAQQEVEQTLHALRETGAEVAYVNADVTDSDEILQSRLAEPVSRLGEVNGIIHGAGVLRDRLIEKKTVQDYEDVFSTKVDGLRNLLKIAPPSRLDFLVLFSSVVGFFGNVGQADYAMANEVLNKTAYQVKRENPACRVISINWGPWDSGMAAARPELQRLFAQQHVSLIPKEAGADMMVQELTSGTLPESQPVQILVGALPFRPPVDLHGSLQHFEISRHLSLEANPFLLDHRIGANPVLPATCAASWAASVCEQIYPGFTFHTLEDFKVLKGIVFDENLAEEHILDLQEIEKKPGAMVKFAVLIWSRKKDGKPLYHYSLNVTLLRDVPEVEPHPIAFQDSKDSIEGKRLYADGTLFHGVSFQGVQRVYTMGEGNLLLECMLPGISPAHQGQFPLQTSNPYVYDAIVQSILIWTQKHYQAPCLPSYLARLEHYRAIPFDVPCRVDMQIVEHSATMVVADIWVTDAQGRVYVKLTNLQGTISPALKRLISGQNPSLLPGENK